MIDVTALIKRIASEEHIDAALALATAEEESGFDPRAVGDSGCSFGLFQANRCGGAGTGYSVDQLTDPDFNARQFAARIRDTAAHGAYATPGELAAAAQRPANPTAYADAVNALYRKYAPDVAAAPVHPTDADRGTASSTPAISVPDVGSAAAAAVGTIASLPAKAAGAVAGRVAGAAVERVAPSLVVLLVFVLVLVILVEVVA